ncbi:hypothetical protein AeMF1_017171 [Aphanomyces euteiches]|nr:hypothetical protein AeMF1_017171 [Aphanomyces euteiches]
MTHTSTPYVGNLILPGLDDEANTAEAADAMLWHARMGYIPVASMTAVCKASIGGPNNLPRSVTCEDCIRGKIQHRSVPKSGDRPRHALGTCVHTDLWGSTKTTSPNGAKYFIAFTEDATNYVWVKFLAKKSDAYDAVLEYIPWLERQTGVKLKTLRSDGGGEYVSEKLEGYLRSCGIHHEVSTPNRQWQNGTAERMNRTLVEMARTMLLHANAPKHWWAEAVNTAAFLRNRTLNTKTADKTPHEMIRGTRPKIASLKVFGCVCWRRNTAQDKTASRANKCIFLGYSETKKAYKVYDVEERKVTYTVDCTFNETEFLWPKVVFVDDIEEPGDSTTHPKDDTKADVDMNESSPPSTTSLENTNAPTQPKAPVRFPNVPFAYYPPPVRIHDTRASRRAAAAAHTQDELPASPRESRRDRPHRQSTKKQSTSPGRTRQAAMDATEAARNAARASTVERSAQQRTIFPTEKESQHSPLERNMNVANRPRRQCEHTTPAA